VESTGGIIRKLAIAAFASAGVLALAGCHQATRQLDDVVIESEIFPQPLQTGLVTLNLKARDAASRPVTGARIELEGDMTHAGMAPVFGKATEGTQGNYRGSLDLPMGGDWVILMHVRLAGGQEIERQIKLKGVRAK
jgi:YtkA-like